MSKQSQRPTRRDRHTIATGGNIMLLAAPDNTLRRASVSELRRAAHALADMRGLDLPAALLEQLTALFAMALACETERMPACSQPVAARAVVERFTGLMLAGAVAAGVQPADVYEAVAAGLVEAAPTATPAATLQA